MQLAGLLPQTPCFVLQDISQEPLLVERLVLVLQQRALRLEASAEVLAAPSQESQFFRRLIEASSLGEVQLQLFVKSAVSVEETTTGLLEILA
eukprot:CAMPEP_0171144930 /NCGR_PEP_ID=MMETSP0766_2-20121228/146774_1 /TAXON_ID=439317 /ORGANISM="Gambierdiscus australes, Strain CAWD 149" /LENGTH=92 /DNA_ID=CAMNT_0011608811 /DNA_START=165 /DNA_END=440 /DNA_ORIENTATION=+